MEEVRNDSRSKKNKKKSRKDKWGQPVLFGIATEVEEEIEEEELCSYEPKVVVSGMTYTITEDDILDFFEGVGPVAQLQLSGFLP